MDYAGEWLAINRFVAIIVIGAFGIGGSACTSPGTPMPAQSTMPVPQAVAPQPWVNAQALVRATSDDLSKRGLQSIRPHVPELERALAGAKEAIESARSSGIVLADGPTETLGALILSAGMAKAQGMQVKQTTAVANPYPLVSFYLGTYYNEIGRSEDALRALDAGLALPTPLPGSDIGETAPLLIGERGAALEALKRPQDALANFDRGLNIKSLKADQRALMLRGRGFALTELGRLDEAEKSYRDSLAVEPNNQRAMNELTYIQRLRAGGPTAPTALFTRMPMMSP